MVKKLTLFLIASFFISLSYGREFEGGNGLGKQDTRLKTPSSGIVGKTPSSGILQNRTSSGDLISQTATSLELGFDFDAASGITLNGSDVSRWNDSYSTNHTTQTTASNQPSYTLSNSTFNGFPSVNFASSATEWLGFDGSTLPFLTYAAGLDVPMTIFAVVYKPVKMTADEVLVGLGNLATSTTYYSFGLVYQNSNTQRQRIRIQSSTVTAETTQTGTDEVMSYSPVVLCYTLTGTDMEYRLMGTSQNPFYDIAAPENNATVTYSTQGVVTSLNRFSLGAFARNTVTLPVNMQVARILGYKQALSDSERYEIASFLWNKYIKNQPEVNDFAGIVNNWDASQLSIGVGAPVSTFTDVVGGKNFRADLSTRPIVALGPNGQKVVQFDGTNDFMTAGSAGDWTLLHSTNPKTVAIVYRVIDSSRAAFEPLIDTFGNTPSTTSGLGLYHYNVGGGSHTFTWAMGAQITTAPATNWKTQGYQAVPQEWHIGSFTYETAMPSAEENFKFWFDNEPFDIRDFQATPSSNTAAFTLTMGRLASNTTTFARVEIAQVVVFDRALGYVYEMGLFHKALARKWGIGITVPVGGNGYPDFLSDDLPHRAFPALTFDNDDNMHIIYRRAVDHGSSAGSVVQATSDDGLNWPTEETVVASGEVRTDVSDWRVGSGFITTESGRMIWSTEVSSSDSGLAAGSVYALYSDNNGSSYTRVHINPEQLGYDLNGSAAGLIQTQSGKIILTFAASEPAEGSGDQDLYITSSTDNGTTWNTPAVLIDHEDITYRITETSHVQYADGMMLMLWRDDTNHVIYKATSTNEYLTKSTATAFSGWGWPNIVLDENERLYCFYRSEILSGSDRSVYRYTDDRGLTWSSEVVLTNQGNANLTRLQYPNMTYTDAKKDAEGNIWIAYGLQSTDSDIFAKMWRKLPTNSTTTIANIDGVVRWWSTYGMSNNFVNSENVGGTGKEWDDLSTNNDNAVQATGGLRPLYTENAYDGQPVVTFDGSDDALEFTEVSLNDWTVFFAVDSSFVGAVLGDAPANNFVVTDPSFGFTNVDTSAGSYTWFHGVTFDPYDVIAVNSDGKIWRNGQPLPDSDIVPGGSLVLDRIGYSNFYGAGFGGLGDALISDEILSASDMNTIGEFLAERWDKSWTSIQ